MKKSVFPCRHRLVLLSLLGLMGCYSSVTDDSSAEKAIAIDWVEPPCAEPGSEAGYIEGNGFGAENVTVTVAGIPAEVLAATGHDASFVVPYGISPGQPIEVVVMNPGGRLATIQWVACGFDCSVIDCTSDDECVEDGTCDPATGMCIDGGYQPPDTSCGDGDVCDGSGSCVECNDAGQCNDDDVCTVDSCDPALGCVWSPPPSCGANTCGVASCDATGDCVIYGPDSAVGATIVDFDFGPKAVDVTDGPADVTCSITATTCSDLPVADASCTLYSPSGNQNISCLANTPATGDTSYGVWTCTDTIPQGAESGVWTVARISARTTALLVKTVPHTADLQSAGFPTQLAVASSEPDVDPPTITNFDFNPKTVDVTDGPAEITCSITAADGGVGVRDATCTFQNPSWGSGVSCIAHAPTTGDPSSGVWSCAATVPQGWDGVWTATTVTARDTLLQMTRLVTSDLEALGFPTQFEATHGGGSGPDLDPPVLVDFDFTPQQVDVSAQSQTVTCEVTVTDSGTGASTGVSPSRSRCVLAPPIGSGLTGEQCNLHLSSGDVFSGIWTCNITIPQSTTPGAWLWDEVTMYDAAGNRFHHRTADLQALGFPTQLDVTSSAPDLDPPVLVDFDFAPQQVDVSAQSQTVTCEVTVTDSGTGASTGVSPSRSRCVLAPPIGSGLTGEQCNLHLSSGDVFSGIWTCNITIPQSTTPGAWLWDEVTMYDAAGNRFHHRTADLQALGFPTQLDVTSSAPDLDPPVLVDFDFAPQQVDVSAQSQTVTCEVTVTDSGTGASTGVSPSRSRCVLAPPIGSGLTGEQCNLHLSSGDVFSGIWTCNITIPQSTTPGAWLWDEVTMYDAAGNRFHHRTADLQALGFPTQLDVTYGSGSPTP